MRSLSWKNLMGGGSATPLGGRNATSVLEHINADAPVCELICNAPTEGVVSFDVVVSLVP